MVVATIILLCYNPFMSKKTGLKNRTPLTSAVRNDLYEQLKAYSLESDIPMSKLMDRAIRLLLKEVGRDPNSSQE